MRVRLAAGGRTSLRALIRHPMETGRRIGADGRVVPAHYIEHLEVRRNGAVLVDCVWSTGVSRNPYLSLSLANTRRGDEITLAWRDNRGGGDARTVTVA